MKTVIFDFNEISDLSGFYRIFQKKFSLYPGMANNLDGIWDTLTGIIGLPVQVEFQNLSLDKLEKFKNLISLFEEAEGETNNGLIFSYFISK
jgi:ribonuclease inhibitor